MPFTFADIFLLHYTDHFLLFKGRSKKTKSRRPRDDDTYDDGTFYTNDFTEYSSRSGERSVGSQTNDSQTYDSRLHLSDNVSAIIDKGLILIYVAMGTHINFLSSGTQGLGCMG